MWLPDWLDQSPYLIAFVFGFGFLVFIHELGHFLAARAVGIRATQFAVGFGQAILSWRSGIGLRVGGTEKIYAEKIIAYLNGKLEVKPDLTTRYKSLSASEPIPVDSLEGLAKIDPKLADMAAQDLGLGETEYRLNWIPLGGYVKMLGQEDLDPNAKSDDPRAFNNKSIGARMIVISAGVVMNLIIGAIFFIAAFSGGVNFPPAVAGSVVPGSPAAMTYAKGHEQDPAYKGLRIGDRIVEADGDVVRDLTGVSIAAALSQTGDTVEFVVQRPRYEDPNADPTQDYDTLTFPIKPDFLNAPGIPGGGRLRSIGIMQPSTTRVGFIVADSDAYAAGVRPEMTITAVNGQAISTYGELAYAMNQSGGETVTLTYTDEDGNQLDVAQEAYPTLHRAGGSTPMGLLGWSPVISADPVDDQPAANAGVQSGDLLMSVQGEAWPTSARIIELIGNSQGPIEITVMRDGERIELPSMTKQMNGKVGVGLPHALDVARISTTLPDSPAATLNFPPGSVIKRIAGAAVSDWSDIQRSLQAQVQKIDANPDDASLRSVKVEAELALADRPIEEATVLLNDESINQIRAAGWVGLQGIGFESEFSPIVADGPLQAIGLGTEYTIRFIQQTYLTLLRLGQGSVSPTELRGPLGIVDVGRQATQDGWTKYLYFLALISVNLAVLNFLPIPITDGGHIVYLIIEKITGNPPSEQVIQWATLAGMLVLGSLFLFVTYQDILRLLGLAT